MDMDLLQNKLIVISGCSGGGKSTLLSELRHNGYAVIPEIEREIVKEQSEMKSDITPWQNPQVFCEVLITRSIADFHRAKAMKNVMGQMIFFDRSFLEGIRYYQTLKVKDSNQYDHFMDALRYYPVVFIAPPWKEIFCQDEERRHSFEDTLRSYERLVTFYPDHGYHVIELPKVSVKERMQFVISFMEMIPI